MYGQPLGSPSKRISIYRKRNPGINARLRAFKLQIGKRTVTGIDIVVGFYYLVAWTIIWACILRYLPPL